MEISKPPRHMGLAPLRPDRAPSCYRLGPGSSDRMGLLAPGHVLQEIDRIEINRFVEREAVVYYVLEVYWKNQRRKSLCPTTAPRVVNPSNSDDVLIDVDLHEPPDLVLERRYSDFEALRHKLSVSFENLHADDCAYCDTFLAFLSCSWTQPGLLTKLMTRAPQRKSILRAFINQTILLAVQRVEGQADGASADCDGWTIIPQVVESFLREPTTTMPT